jgi:HEAT repeat protein
VACASAPRAVEPPPPSEQSAAARDRQLLREKVENLLAGGASSSEWRAQDAETLKVLEQVAQDAGAAPKLRAAAVLALAGLGWSVAALMPYLNDAVPEVRAAAAIAVARAGGADSKAALEARLEKEEDPSVREALQRALTLLQP